MGEQIEIPENDIGFNGYTEDYYESLYQQCLMDETIKNLINQYNKVVGCKNINYVFIIDEINRGEISKIFGELFFSIDPGYRGIAGRIKTQYQNLIDKKDIFYEGFYVPENVYIIGTMNDIDRSVESMDLAMRRRFTFVEITAEDSREAMLTKENKMLADVKELQDLNSRMEKLNQKIISEEIGLSKDYQIGAAYFLKFLNYREEDNPFESLWEYNLKPLLQEYLRGQDDGTKLNLLESAYKN